MMKRMSQILLFFFISLISLFGIFLGPCAAAGPRVIATVFPLYDMAKGVAGDRAEVTLLLPPGANPHSWEPRPSDMINLQKADLIIMVGAGLEPWAHEIIEKKDKDHPRILKVSDGAPLVILHGHDHEEENHGHGVDPHIWLDFSWDMTIVNRICQTLIELDPEGREVYQRGAQAYKESLDQLIDAYKKGLANCKTRSLVVGGHGAFNYLARAFGLKQVSLYGISPDAQPTPRRMAEVIEIVRREGVKAIFFEETVSDKLARVLARETGARVLTLTPGASLTREQIQAGASFLDLMYENLRHLIEGLGC